MARPQIARTRFAENPRIFLIQTCLHRMCVCVYVCVCVCVFVCCCEFAPSIWGQVRIFAKAAMCVLPFIDYFHGRPSCTWYLLEMRPSLLSRERVDGPRASMKKDDQSRGLCAEKKYAWINLNNYPALAKNVCIGDVVASGLRFKSRFSQFSIPPA